MKNTAKKSLGQNFLIDKNIIKKIVSAANIKNNEILEIGAGKGSLTGEILKRDPKNFYVIEKDDNLCSFLEKKFGEKIKIINEDVLNINENFISEKKLVVFGNLPYNISTEIICKWILNLQKKVWFTELVLMFQKEVADRIIAKSDTSEFGRLSLLSQWRLDIKKLFDISPSCFRPKPNVESTLLLFLPKKKFPKFNSAKNLETITRVFFNQRRKMIKNPFKQLFKNYREISKKLNINLNLRPQNLSFETFYKITKEYEKL